MPPSEVAAKPGLSRGSIAAVLAALLLATALAYQPAWHGAPLWDDDAHLTRPDLRDAEGLGRIWWEIGATQQYYPLVHTAFWAMHRLWGDATTGYHLVSILLHGISSGLLFVILRRLRVPGATLAAFLFALHPVNVESVAWITELKNTLSTVWYLAAAWVYLRFDETRRFRDWMLAAVAFALALLSKTVTATLPLSLLIVFWWRRGRLEWRKDVRPLIPFVVLGITAGVTTAWVEHTHIGAKGVEFNLTFVERGLVAGRALWFYLAKLAWPADLAFIYPRWSVDDTVWWQYLFPAAAMALLLACWQVRRRSRAPLAVLLLYAVALGPALGFVNVFPFRYSYVADHFQYAASLAPLAFAAAGLAWFARTRRASDTVRVGLAAGLLIALGLVTRAESRQYTDAATLYRSTIARNPSAWMAHHNLGELALRSGDGDVSLALPYLEEAARLNPEAAEVRNSRGFAYQQLGRLAEARREYEAAIALNPGFADPHNNLGVLAFAEGDPARAERHYRDAIRLNPADPEPRRNLGLALLTLGRADEAAPFIHEEYERAPNSADALAAMGSLGLMRGQTDEAIAYFQRALAANPDHGRAHDNLGYTLLQQGRLAEAYDHLSAAVRLQPDFAPSHVSLALALHGLGRLDEAIAAFELAFQHAENRRDAGAYNAYGVALAQRGRTTEAVAAFREALRLDPGSAQARANLARAQGK